MKEQILEGQVKKAFSDKVLMNQPYILDDTKTVEQFIKEAIAKTGENITVKQFKRIELGVTEKKIALRGYFLWYTDIINKELLCLTPVKNAKRWKKSRHDLMTK